MNNIGTFALDRDYADDLLAEWGDGQSTECAEFKKSLFANNQLEISQVDIVINPPEWTSEGLDQEIFGYITQGVDRFPFKFSRTDWKVVLLRPFRNLPYSDISPKIPIREFGPHDLDWNYLKRNFSPGSDKATDKVIKSTYSRILQGSYPQVSIPKDYKITVICAMFPDGFGDFHNHQGLLHTVVKQFPFANIEAFFLCAIFVPMSPI